ncbi:uncharacterized protein EI90DRAFT_716687 [Cantharellus anzutake]|uniref:uncharacterized protein n=1 Tax=Cantharellus anzutake TaxID=1750568 RepID=UPI001906E171|nr:uncharacterized protein EI90DRAFT_716687 [Cantharellus anzutake]KAF8312408.1 hypothetical protein EI90DRAFT_716687 [Cantharellus anzutake]
MPMPSRSEENSMPIRSESDLSGALPLRDWLPCLERCFKRDHIPLSYLLTNTEIYLPTRARIWRGSHEVAELLDREARWKNTERRRVWSQIFRDAYQILSTNSTHLRPDIGLERKRSRMCCCGGRLFDESNAMQKSTRKVHIHRRLHCVSGVFGDQIAWMASRCCNS